MLVLLYRGIHDSAMAMVLLLDGYSDSSYDYYR